MGIVGLVESIINTELWIQKAICASTDPESFFPEKGQAAKEAKKVCLGCPVRAECLSYALRRDERFGVWGGLSERERRRLKRYGIPARTHCGKRHELAKVGLTSQGACKECRRIWDEGYQQRVAERCGA